MDAECRTLADTIGRLVVERDMAGVHGLLAPWLQVSSGVSDIDRMITEAWEGLAPPRSWTIDQGAIDLGALRRPDGFGPPTAALPEDITPANYRGWFCVQFQPDPVNPEGFNVCFDLWLAAVEHDGAYRVGYLEAAEAS